MALLISEKEKILENLQDDLVQKIFSLDSLDFLVYGYFLNPKFTNGTLSNEVFNAYDLNEVYRKINGFEGTDIKQDDFKKSIHNLLQNGFINQKNNVVNPTQEMIDAQDLSVLIFNYSTRYNIDFQNVVRSHNYEDKEPMDRLETFLMLASYSNNPSDISEKLDIPEDEIIKHAKALKKEKIIEEKEIIQPNQENYNGYLLNTQGDRFINNVLQEISNYGGLDGYKKVKFDKKLIRNFKNKFNNPDISKRDQLRKYIVENGQIDLNEIIAMGYSRELANKNICDLLNQKHIRLKEGNIYGPTHKLAQYVKEKRLMD